MPALASHPPSASSAAVAAGEAKKSSYAAAPCGDEGFGGSNPPWMYADCPAYPPNGAARLQPAHTADVTSDANTCQARWLVVGGWRIGGGV